uniref:Bromodomain-containing protein 8 n=1 Tax=Amphiprion ocellaris TaxID=80972 RepID=A0AAQ5XMP1_AMPOC
MANGVGKHKLLVIGPTEPWSVREKLCLATSVMKSGDQNWVSVSRTIKPFAEPGRPPDWFSQKHCASKYSELLETTEAPKRKRGEKGEVVETVEDVIVRRLTSERIEELKKLIKETQEKHRKLKREAELIQAGHLDSKLEDLWEEIRQKKKLEEEEAELKRKNTDAAYQGISFNFMLYFASGTARLLTFTESSGSSTDDISHGSLLDDPTQKKLMGQKATPPPSPLLSELLKKGSILAANSRLVCRGTFCIMPAVPNSIINMHETAGHPFFIGSFLELLSIQKVFNTSVVYSVSGFLEVDVLVPSAPPGCQPVSTEDKVSELSEEDVTVSYMGDELDLKTVGDIIAIIEDKADEAAEALDAAAVEAALSLCEENGHTLSGAWDAGPFRPHESHPTVPTGAPQSSSLHRSLEGRTEASLSSLCNSQDNHLAAFPMGLRSLPPTSSSSRNSKSLEHCHSGAPPQSEAMRETGGVEMKVKNGISGGGRENASGTKVENEVNGPELCGEDEGDGVEEFFSEPDGETELEPAASESEDGYSLHTASSSLQLHTTADSIPSSPASSQFSVCSEDLEALQAHKIWKKAIMLVWRAAANHRYANVFLQPVTDEIAPGYHSIVHRPMDLATIKKNIETGLIRTTAEFQRDIMLMFQNAVMYNSLDHDVYHMAVEMQRDVLEQIQQFLATQLIMETAESGISAKSLRGRESTRKQDSTDKVEESDAKLYLLAIFQSMTFDFRLISFQVAIGFVCYDNQLSKI